MKDVPELKPFDVKYSLKNIPISNRRSYMIKLFDMANNFINRLRWKAYFYEKKMNQEKAEEEADYDPEYDIFPSKRYGPWSDNLAAFENDLFDLIKNTKFKRSTRGFQKTLADDVRRIKDSPKVIVFSDKTNNLYEMEPEDYRKLLFENITREYKKCDRSTLEKIDLEAGQIISGNAKRKRIPKYQKSEAFLSIKDHKENFPNSISCRLINPSKTHMGKVSKDILDNINGNVRKHSGLVQWKNSRQVIDWFNKIDTKAKKRFICFDIVSFYPSIMRKHLTDALVFAKKYIKVSKKDTDTVMHACKSILMSNGEIWRKNGKGSSLFDIPMGSFHGAEVCDLIGLYILKRLQEEIPEGEFGLYRDDGLGVTREMSGPEFERLSKKIRKLFADIGFQVTIETGAVTTNFLDVTLSLKSGSYNPYRKPNSALSYIHRGSNHPPNVNKALPKMIQNRLVALSKDEEAFNRHKGDYEDALKKSGYDNYGLKFAKNSSKPKNRRRRRKAIFFNAPFCLSVQTKIGKEFFRIVDHHFKPSHPYYAIFNRKTIKLSYSCMTNMGSIIKAHNSRVLRESDPNESQPPKSCSCPKTRKDQCPLQQKCLTENIIYKATVSTPSGEKEYIGSTGRSFKERFSGHKHALRHRESQQSTTLSKYAWKMRDAGETPEISWSIIHKIPKPRGPQRICTTCNLERMAIACADRKRSLNKRSELTGKCIHFRSFYF